ncbi:hypothetical protein [Hwangdonia lutea]|uniref:Uncharacterized protein n=1 Tax=Hwangdonia lutea TaxID=3075823 RepID=A0AA97HRR7_9FLAO|nr:hypothetical protein [Hwangdonia sp. SCSIO 19198]WOD44927.1 hypothetical protein RNZ46_06565 [Hwangdonia sp. SCSIO 19198]
MKMYTRPMLFYNKVFYQNGKKITKEYANYKLSCYYEEEILERFKIVRGFGADGGLFHTEVTYLDSNGKPYMNFTQVNVNNGTLDACYRRINKLGQHSYQGYKDFYTCYFEIKPN